MENSLDRNKVTPKVVRHALNKSNLSNIAVAREVKIPIRSIAAFRKGDDNAISTLDRIKILTLIRKGTF
jgi:hypothetical protein